MMLEGEVGDSVGLGSASVVVSGELDKVAAGGRERGGCGDGERHA